MATIHQDLSVIYYTANQVPEAFGRAIRDQILESAGDASIISVSHRPLDFGENIVVDLPRHHLSIYKQALIGAKAATTEFIALTEDDVLYSSEHFKHRPQSGKFAYNIANWGIYTWVDPPIFSWKGRRNLSALICERELFIEAMEERFAKHGDDVETAIWAEPGKYERHLRVTPRETEEYWSSPPNVVFSHETALAFGNLGRRKRLGELRAYRIPFWGDADEVIKIYRGER